MDVTTKMSRGDFIKKLGLASLGLVCLSLFGKKDVLNAAVFDNLSATSGGVKFDSVPPANPNMLWVKSRNHAGYFYDGSKWDHIRATWS